MKFADGNWMIQQGMDLIPAVQVFTTNVKKNEVDVLVAPRDVESRSGQLDVPLLTIRYSTPIQDVISVEVIRHEGRKKRKPAFEVFEQAETNLDVADLGDFLILTSGEASVKLPKSKEWSAEYFYGEKQLTKSDFKAIAHITADTGKTYIKDELNLSVDELIYGLGERFTEFVKNGQTVDIWNKDGGTSTEQAYKNIPFYLSNRGYGIFINHPENVSFEVGSEKVSKVQFSVEGESLHYYIIGGRTLREVVSNYTSLTGKPALPPAWSYGLWLTTSFTTNYDEQTVNEFVDGMLERNIPLSVFHFDCFWMKGFHWTDFEWDSQVFPDPAGMLKRLKDKGLKISIWINPYIAQQSSLFAEACEKGYLIHRPNGDVWQWDKWQPGMGIVDFTNPEACEWYANHLRRLVDMGVDSFKTDFGERIPTDVVYHNGEDPQKMHNYYAFLYNKLVFEVLEEKLGKNEAVLFARSATAGGQQFPVHWGGDCYATYESMAESLRGGLSLGLSGFGFWSHDMGGFEQTATPDLYKRWTAFGLMSTHSRLHGNQSYRVPWIFDEEAVDITRFFSELKSSLMPYIYSSSIASAQEGVPMMRAMVLDYTNDPACKYLDKQYMFGDSLLVAPIFNDEGVGRFYLPEGKWTHLLSNEVVEGGRWQHKEYSYFDLPLYAKPNSILAIGSEKTTTDYDFADQVTLHLFELEDEQQAETTIYNTKAEAELIVKVKRRRNEITIDVENYANKDWTFVLRNLFTANEVRGAKQNITDEGLSIEPKEKNGKIMIIL
ncbi:alpha-xylosidase [Bacillus sp. FSL K6-3431]|uniref:alpha-xylosidase n=1 Tax=Bacillus sp. FSL K6-3431 TaxID=2921500 RepID=UPI0030F9FD8A